MGVTGRQIPGLSSTCTLCDLGKQTPAESVFSVVKRGIALIQYPCTSSGAAAPCPREMSRQCQIYCFDYYSTSSSYRVAFAVVNHYSADNDALLWLCQSPQVAGALVYAQSLPPSEPMNIASWLPGWVARAGSLLTTGGPLRSRSPPGPGAPGSSCTRAQTR